MKICRYIGLLAALMMFTSPLVAFAQDSDDESAAPAQTEETGESIEGCATINSNEKWNELYGKFLEAYSEDNFQEAIAYGDEMKKICSISPVLNYMMGSAYQQKGDLTSSLKYYRNATDNVDKLAISADQLNQIWESRLDAEVEYASNSAVKVAFSTGKGAALNMDTPIISEQYESWKKVFYTGIGLTAGGGAVLATGLALYFVAYSKVEENLMPKDAVNLHNTGIAMAGVGGGLLGGGVAMLTLGKLKMDKIKLQYGSDSNGNAENVEVGLDFTGNGFMLSGTF